MLADFFWSVGLKGRGLWQKNPHSQRPSLFSILLLVFEGPFYFPLFLFLYLLLTPLFFIVGNQTC